MARIRGEKVSIQNEKMTTFFEKRGREQAFGDSFKYNVTMLQDDNPNLARKRHEYEVKKISSILNLKSGQRILDLGCGAGRWGEVLLERGLYYVGIDASPSLIGLANRYLNQYPNKKLKVGLLQNIKNVLSDIDETSPYDHIFVNGVFQYVNDDVFIKSLQDIHSLSGTQCYIYFKEPIGISDRLTLNNEYSDTLKDSYNSIYRTEEEYLQSFNQEFEKDFQLIVNDSLYDSSLKNRKETESHYFIYKKKL